MEQLIRCLTTEQTNMEDKNKGSSSITASRTDATNGFGLQLKIEMKYDAVSSARHQLTVVKIMKKSDQKGLQRNNN